MGGPKIPSLIFKKAPSFVTVAKKMVLSSVDNQK